MVLTKIKYFLKMIDFGHSLFGLPFAYLGAFLAARGVPAINQLFWITIAMVSARTAALCLNRIIDIDFDRANPRTSTWVLPSGKLKGNAMWIYAVICTIILMASAAQLNPLCLKLAPLAIIVLWGYSYTKRFTWWCHLILGIAIGSGTVGSWIAITGTLDWEPIVLGMAVACWIAGFDTMYACQDIKFDRQQGLYSIPSRFGETGALRFSAVFHALTVLFLLIAGIALDLGLWYYLGVAFAASVLAYEHIIVKPGKLNRVNFASFQINHYVGLIILCTSLLDLLI